MAFRLQAGIDPNHHKGLVLLNSITGRPLIATGLSLTNSQPIHVAIVDGTGAQVTSFGGTGGTSSSFGSVFPATGTAAGAIDASGNMAGLNLDGSGNLKVSGSLSVGGTVDNSAFTAGTTQGTPTMGFYHSTIDTVTDGRAATVGITSKRAMLVTLQTSAGADTGVAASPLQVSLANTGANTNKLLVTADPITFASAQPVTLASTTITGTVGVTQSTSPWVVGGNVASGATDSGNPVKIGGVNNTTQPTLTDGQRGDLQVDTKANLKTVLYANNTATTASFNADNADAVAVSATANKLVVLGRNTVFNGTTWDRLPGDTTGVSIKDGGNSITVDNAGTFAVQAAQSGTWNITNISGTVSLPTGASTENTLAKLAQTQGSTTSGQSGPLIQGAVTTAAPSYTTAQTSPLSLDTAGNLRTTTTLGAGSAVIGHVITDSGSTTVVTGSVTVVGNKTNNNAAPGATNVGALVGIANAAAPTYTEGDQVLLSTDLSGNLRITGSISVGGTTDEAAWTAGSSTFTPTGGVFNDTATALTTGQQGTQRLTANRGVHANLRNASGTEIGTSATPVQVSLANTASNATAVKVDGSAVTQPVSLTSTTITGTVSVTQSGTWNIGSIAGTITPGTGATNLGKAEDAASASGDVGVGAIVIQQAAPADNAGTDGDYSFMQMSAGRLWTSSKIDTALPAGSNVIGHVITDTGSTTAVTGTVTISGTVTANAGTNLNTSLLALESGGNLASIKTDVDNLNLAQASTTSGQKGNLVLAATTTAAPTYTTAQSNPLSLTTTGLLRVDGSGVTQPVSLTSTTITGTVAVTQSTSPWIVAGGGTAGTAATGVVTVQGIASMTKLLVTPDSVALPANQSVNVSQINGVTPLMGNGTTGTGSQRVTIASDNTAFSVNATLSAETTKVIGTVNQGTSPWITDGASEAATAAAVPASAAYIGGTAQTSLPTATTAGQLTGAMVDKFGRQVVLGGTVRDLRKSQHVTITSSTAETTVVTAGAAGILNDLVAVLVANSSATATRVDFRDATAGTIIFTLAVPASGTAGLTIPGESWPQTTAANNWTAQSNTSVASLDISILYEQNK